MIRAALLIALLILQDTGPRTPVPDQEKQKEAEKAIKDLFKAEYGRKQPADRQLLAQTLLRQARDSKGDPAAQWVLFREAQDMAVQGGDLDLAFEAANGTATVFEVSAAALKLALLATAAKAAKTPDELVKIADKHLELSGAALAADDFDLAEKALAGGTAAAKRSNSAPLAAKVSIRAKEISESKSRFEKIRKAMETLAKDAKNGPANLEVGLYHCFGKKNWEAGLPFLRDGSDAALSAAAAKDLARPAEAAAQVEAGDAWWDLSEKERNDAVRRRMQERAAYWYDVALPSAAGLVKTKVTLRLDTVKMNELAVGYQVFFGEKGGSPNLIPCDADDGHFEIATVGGKSAVRLTEATIDKSDGTRYLYVNVVPAWKENWRPVDIEMEYFDEGRGNVDVHYDAVSGIYKTGLKSFVLGNSRTWKTFTFTLPEPSFQGRLKGGSDFRIHIFPGSPVAFHRMTVRVPKK
jgi:hypothetical protein